MSITINQIDELRERTGVNYSDAKEALENSNGDMLEAIIYLEKNNKAKASKKSFSKSGLSDKISALLRKGSTTRFIMSKQDKVILNISMNIAVLIGLIFFPLIELIALVLLIALLTGHKFKFESTGSDTSKINETLDKVYDSVNLAKEKFAATLSTNTDKAAE